MFGCYVLFSTYSVISQILIQKLCFFVNIQLQDIERTIQEMSIWLIQQKQNVIVPLLKKRRTYYFIDNFQHYSIPSLLLRTFHLLIQLRFFIFRHNT